MAEGAYPEKKPLWPTLKRKLVEAKNKAKRRKPKKQNPFASQGLEKFATLMAELQAKKASLVDKTGNSVSAVRYLSRSAQEWTASTLARTASRRRDKMDLSPRSSEVLLLQQWPPGSGFFSNVSLEIETVELSQSFSFSNPGHGLGFDSEALVVGDLEKVENNLDDAAAEEVREPIREGEEREEASCSGKKAADCSGLPLSSAILIRNGRLLLLEKSWSRSPSAVLALLVALGACLGSRLTRFGNSVLELLTTNFVVRWQKGKLWADFLQSSVTRHVVPHLSIRVPRGLALLHPLVRRKISPDHANPRQKSVEAQSEIELVEEPNRPGNFMFPVVPENSSFSASDLPALAALHFQAEASDSSSSASSVRTPGSTRRFVKKLSSKLKAKMSKSGSSPTSQLSPSIRRRSSKFPFSRRNKEKEMSDDDGWPDEEVFAADSSKKRCILKKKCSFRKDKTPEPSITTTTRRSPLGRNFSLESSSSTDITSSLHDAPIKSIFDAGLNNFNLWLIVGLLVALLFLLVSRFSAVVAVSSLFLILSCAHKESSYYRLSRRDVDTTGRQSVEIPRKLHRSPIYGGRLGGPCREDSVSSNPRH